MALQSGATAFDKFELDRLLGAQNRAVRPFYVECELTVWDLKADSWTAKELAERIYREERGRWRKFEFKYPPSIRRDDGFYACIFLVDGRDVKTLYAKYRLLGYHVRWSLGATVHKRRWAWEA